MASKQRRIPGSLAMYGGMGAATPEIERRFFTNLRLPNGTSKTTYRHRLDDLNERLLEFLPSNCCLTVMDVAISSGVSTLEWSDHLQAHGFQHKLVAGDLVTDGWLTSWGTSLAVLVDSSGRDPLLFEMGRVTLPVRSDRRLARVARPFLFPVLRAVATLGGRAGPAPSMAPAVPRQWVHRSISLVSPELHRRPEIEIVQDDITVPGRFPSAFDVIRVANLVQRVYFDDDTLRRIMRNLRDRLRDGGILVICRTTEDGVNNATIFRRTGDRFISEASLNSGADVRDLALAL
jgi:SAM-dependent methyltransferase